MHSYSHAIWGLQQLVLVIESSESLHLPAAYPLQQWPQLVSGLSQSFLVLLPGGPPCSP